MTKSLSRSATRSSSAADAATNLQGLRDTHSLRIRAAWMYYVEQRTQSEIAKLLNVGRVTVVRMLADARARNEVQLSIVGDLAETTSLSRQLETRFGLQEAFVSPLPAPDADPLPGISAVIGNVMSKLVKADMCIGVGWGRTLQQSLPHMEGRTLDNFRVISLLGGIIQARRFNPADFAWQFAEKFQGEGYLIPAPAVVDSAATRRTLIERCGIDHIFNMTADMDAVLVSVGGSDRTSTTLSVGYVSDEDHDELIAAGAVGDLLFHYFDKDGKPVDHQINERIMSVDIERVRETPLRILATGGPSKVQSLLGGMRLVKPNVLITDQQTAIALLAELDDE